MKKIFFACALVVAMAGSIHAESSERLRPEEGQIIARVDGIVCSFCAYGLEKGLKKLSFVDRKAKPKGVLVDIKKGYVILSLLPEEQISIEKIHTKITDGGYTLKELSFRLRGFIEKTDTGYKIVSKTSGQSFELHSPDSRVWEGSAYDGLSVILEGYLSGESLEKAIQSNSMHIMVRAVQDTDKISG